MTRKGLYEDYYIWLLNKVGVYASEEGAYSSLFHELFTTEFKWMIPMDENRAADGLYLRSEYANETGGFTDQYSKCSFLEMLVSLSIRCENDIMGEPDVDHTREWFWRIIYNLGLEKYDNAHYNPIKVKDILERVCFREYDADGSGGMFPLKNPPGDQRQVEIWYQMGSWLNENFDLVG